jgi:heavy metal translocating P-type ATPase
MTPAIIEYMTTTNTEKTPLELTVRGMHCAGCVSAVETALKRVDGVADASVNLVTQQASVQLNTAVDNSLSQRLVEAIQAVGFEAYPRQDDVSAAEARDERRMLLRQQFRGILIAACFGVPVILIRWFFENTLTPAIMPHWLYGSMLAILTLGVFGAAARSMMAGALTGLLRLRGNMDLLVTLGTLTAFVSGVAGIFTGHLMLMMFDAATMIVLFVSVGKYMESRARGRASAALEALAARIPAEAWRVVDGEPQQVPIDSIVPGDIVRVSSHALIPVDGEVVSGAISVDESMLTGESQAAAREPGDQVYGGTRVLNGTADLRAVTTGKTSAAARLGELVRQAQATKPGWQRLADRLAAWFVPAVLALALGTFTVWYYASGGELLPALNRMISVMVVACPCAMGLAVPTAVLVGTTRAAERGILVRDAGALEAAGTAIEVVIDKTGTLTLGRPSLTQIRVFNGFEEDEVLAKAAALESQSEHPLAKALVRAAEARGLALGFVSQFNSRPGAGITGEVGGADVTLGQANWLKKNGTTASAPPEVTRELEQTGDTIVWVAINGQTAGVLQFADEIHPQAKETIEELKKLDLLIRVLSGDRHIVVAEVARSLKIKAFEAEMTPEKKLSRVRDLSRLGGGVVMVGDGINDAPALAVANVGMAIGTGADVAREAADICLLGHSPKLIPQAIRLSRTSAAVMKQNLFWALIYNLTMVPIAMMTNLRPELATAAMMLSSLTVVLNSLRLRRLI